MAGEKFYIKFVSDGFGEVQIDEPIGYTGLSWDFKQRDKGYGRDILFNGGEASMEFSSERNHYLDKLIYYNHHFGFESKVEMRIVFRNGQQVILDLDFAKAETDDLKYFKCKLIQRSDILLVKRREDTKVDLFSDKDIDGNPITPLATKKILLKPKTVLQESIWKQVSFERVEMKVKTKKTEMWNGNPCQIMEKDDIENTLISMLPSDHQHSPSDYYIIEAANTLTNIKVVIKSGLYTRVEAGHDRGGEGYINFSLNIAYGTNDRGIAGQRFSPINVQIEVNPDHVYDSTTTSDIVINIPLLQRGEKIWVYFGWEVRQSRDLFQRVAYATSTIRNMEIQVTAAAQATPSIAEGVRLIDAVRQVVKSISGKNISAPIFDVGSIYYDTFLLNGNLLRGIINKPFNLSLEDLVNSMTECNADYEVGDVIFFGTEMDFYTTQECWFFDSVQFKEFTKTHNDRMSINQFYYKYKNFQALKENEIPQTADTVHGEMAMTLFNKNVENKRDIQIEWVRDGFLFEEARTKAIVITNETSYQDDDTVFALDTITQTADVQLQESAELSHEYQGNGFLLLRSSTINFALMGIEVGSPFRIFAPDRNAGDYVVVNVTPATLLLGSASAHPNSNNNGIRVTKFRYTIRFTSVPLTNYTIEGFTNITGINDPSSYSNLRFSDKRNIQNYFSEYLATCNQYWADKPIIVTEVKNNKEFQATYNGLTTIEGSEYIPTGKRLTSNIYDKVIFANVEPEDFFALMSEIRTKRGFIRTIDKNGNVIKLYAKKLNYKVPNRELTIMGEEKFEPTQLKISTANQDIMINDETSVHQLDYAIIDHKLFLYDMYRQLLYNGVFWDKVTINGANVESEEELDELMTIIKSINN